MNALTFLNHGSLFTRASVLHTQDPSEASYPAGCVSERHTDHSAGDGNQLSCWHRTYCLSLPGLAWRRGGHSSGWELCFHRLNFIWRVIGSRTGWENDMSFWLIWLIKCLIKPFSSSWQVCIWRHVLEYVANTRWEHKIAIILGCNDGTVYLFYFIGTNNNPANITMNLS